MSYAKQTVRNLLGTVDLVQKAMWAVTVLFALAAVLLTSTTVRLSIFARRREVEIMQLVGATNWFIRWPFVLEGFITGLVGSLIAALAVWGANVLVYNWIHAVQARLPAAHQVPAHRAVGVLAARPHPDAGAGRRRARRPGQLPGAAPLPARLTRRPRTAERGCDERPDAADRVADHRPGAAGALKPRSPGDYHGRSCVRSLPSSPRSSSCSPWPPRSSPATPCAAHATGGTARAGSLDALVIAELKAHYYKPVNAASLDQAGVVATLKSLHDPYTVYITAQQTPGARPVACRAATRGSAPLSTSAARRWW